MRCRAVGKGFGAAGYASDALLSFPATSPSTGMSVRNTVLKSTKQQESEG